MSKRLRYRGGFYSLKQTLYDIEIWQEGYVGSISNIALCDVPLQIEWMETDKLEPVQSSRATLQLFSDTDRQFMDLYTIEVGSIRMDVYRNKTLYWSGTLDPELYEEPFSYKNDYGVSLTFSDLAPLERINWTFSEFSTIREIVERALLQCDIKYIAIEEHISTKINSNSTSNLLTAVSVQTDNFYDEDGIPMTMREVLDETLRPFALRLLQKAGKIIIYDLNSIYTTFNPVVADWSLSDATLGVDKIYNNVKVCFSPYERTTLLKGEVDPDSVTGGQTCTTWINTSAAKGEIGFETRLSDTGTGLEKNNAARYYKITPTYSGTEEAGIAWTVKTFQPGSPSVNYLNNATSAIGSMLFKVPKKAYITHTSQNFYRLKLTLQLLFDPRYNPFEQASTPNDEGNWDEQKNWANYAYVPFLLTLRNESGKALYHWENNGVKSSNSFDRGGFCKWTAGEGSWGDAWLCWYEGNRENESGLGGWQRNKQIIGYYRGGLPVLFDRMDKGEYIDLPPASGWLDLQIGTGVPAYDYKSKTEWQINEKLYEQCTWLLYKDPQLDMVNKYGKSIDVKDVEHSAWINKSAKEELKIDTVLGTLSEAKPTALGQFLRTTDKTVINTFYRGGTTDLLERLFIGMVYSNYAKRHNTLSGTTSLMTKFSTYTDSNEPGAYMVLRETQHLRNDESEILMVRFDADNYKGVKFDE